MDGCVRMSYDECLDWQVRKGRCGVQERERERKREREREKKKRRREREMLIHCTVLFYDYLICLR